MNDQNNEFRSAIEGNQFDMVKRLVQVDKLAFTGADLAFAKARKENREKGPAMAYMLSKEKLIYDFMMEHASEDIKRQSEIMTEIPGNNHIQMGKHAREIVEQSRIIKPSGYGM